MQAAAIESFQELSERWIWPALLHSVWIGLVIAAACALIIHFARGLSHRARHSVLLGAFVLAITGPVIAVVLQERFAKQSTALAPAAEETAARTGAIEAVAAPRAESGSLPSVVVVSRPRSLSLDWLSACQSAARRVRPIVLAAWFLGVAIIAAVLSLVLEPWAVYVEKPAPYRKGSMNRLA